MAAKSFVLIDDFDSALKLTQKRLTDKYGEQDFIKFNSAKLCLVDLTEKNFQPDLIVCDLQMPGMSGLDFLKKIKSSPNLRQIPFVLISADQSEQEVLEAKFLGAQVSAKPISLEAVERSLARSQTQLPKEEGLEKMKGLKALVFDKVTQSKDLESVQAILKNFHELVQCYYKMDYTWVALQLNQIERALEKLFRKNKTFPVGGNDYLVQVSQWLSEVEQDISSNQNVRSLPLQARLTTESILQAPDWIFS